MSNAPSSTGRAAGTEGEPAAHLDIPADRRALHKAHAAMLAETARKVALDIPFSADVDDFRRVLASGARP